MKHKKVTIAAIASASVAALSCAAYAATPLPTNRVGVYVGPGETAKVDAFQTWSARTQLDATDYADPAEATQWNQYMFKYWGDWKKAKPNRQLVLGVHLVPQNGGTLKDGLAGKYDAQYKTMATQLNQQGLGGTVIRLGYEPNNPGIGPWQGTSDPASYKALYRRAYTIMNNQTPDLKFDYNLAVGQSGAVTSFETLYPGDAYVDIVGLNIYDVWWNNPSATPAQRWNNTLTKPMGVNAFKTFAAAHNKPKSYPEWGLYAKGDSYAGGGDNPYFIDRMSELVSGSAYQAYFNYSWGGGTLDSFPNGKAEYKLKFGNR